MQSRNRSNILTSHPLFLFLTVPRTHENRLLNFHVCQKPQPQTASVSRSSRLSSPISRTLKKGYSFIRTTFALKTAAVTLCGSCPAIGGSLTVKAGPRRLRVTVSSASNQFYILRRGTNMNPGRLWLPKSVP